MTTTALNRRQLFIGNEWREASGGRTIPVINPSTEEVIAEVAAAEQADVDAAVAAARAAGAPVVAPFELALFFQRKGLQQVTGMNPGGTFHTLGLSITMVQAFHSSSVEEDGKPVYAGVATGYVVKFENGTTIYFAGDTAVFGDMRLIGEMYRPDIAFLPIGDFYTMGPEQAAKAVELLGVRHVVPMHYGTFPVLTGTPAKLRELVGSRAQVIELKPGQTAS